MIEDPFVERLREDIELNPFDASLYLQLGTLCRHLGRNREAEYVLNEAVKLKPNSLRAWTHLALVYEFLQDTLHARKAWNVVDQLSKPKKDSQIQTILR
jgi:Flp pilus assembly protein TadD